MSKQHPNQDFYKIGGSSQSEGPDRTEAVHAETRRVPQSDANPKHPAVKRSAKKK